MTVLAIVSVLVTVWLCVSLRRYRAEVSRLEAVNIAHIQFMQQQAALMRVRAAEIKARLAKGASRDAP